ncbi:MAG TPA: hypothetical protein VGQ76_20125 [Thermoanaerobaculia bacterium]|nr:hypothetical protein [Thermoanaerobaculia bacterium]
MRVSDNGATRADASSLARSSNDARGIDANELVAKTMATMKKKALLIGTRL